MTKSFVQLNITGRERDRRTRKLYCWCITVNASRAKRKARSLRASKHVSHVEIADRDGSES